MIVVLEPLHHQKNGQKQFNALGVHLSTTERHGLNQRIRNFLQQTGGRIRQVFVSSRKDHDPKFRADQVQIYSAADMPSSKMPLVLSGWYVDHCVLDAQDDVIRSAINGSTHEFHIPLDLVEDDIEDTSEGQLLSDKRKTQIAERYFLHAQKHQRSAAIFMDGDLQHGDIAAPIKTMFYSSIREFLRENGFHENT